MHVFVNEGETILKEFVVNVSENIVHSKNLISFMKSNNILNSKILKKKRHYSGAITNSASRKSVLIEKVQEFKGKYD